MASRVAARPAAPGSSTTTATTAARQPYANAARYAPQSYRRREPPPQYTIERVRGADGVEKEVLTLEDTPDPSPAPAAGPLTNGAGAARGQAHASTSSARQDPYGGYEPAPKKRKSDVAAQAQAQAPGQAYAGAAGYQTYAMGSNAQGPSGYRAQAAASTSGYKRKHDEYERDSGSAYRTSQKGKDKALEYSDKEGHFIVRIGGTVTDSRHGPTSYRIERLLGQGTFGKVVAAKIVGSEKPVAVKIIRNVPKYQEAAKTEVKVLQELAKNDPGNQKKCIQLLQSFDFMGHTCLVTELLSASVFDFLKENAYEPFPLSHVQQFARQLLTSLKYVHDNQLVHTDLKPENILLEDNRSIVVPSRKNKNRKILRNTGIRLIDFGSATFEDHYHAQVVSTRHYRAPEIILCLGWSYPCDMWSIGCILVEFITGEALFQTHENLEHLAMMEKVFGPMPPEVAKDARTCTIAQHPEWFKAVGGGRSRSPNFVLNFPTPQTQKQSKKYVSGMRKLSDIISPSDPASQRFLSLCEGLLRWEREKRLTVHQALAHPFFDIAIEDDGTTYGR
ncbi:hypothetical protein JCM1841_003205 [Sporobolomyces salmonicolor]